MEVSSLSDASVTQPSRLVVESGEHTGMIFPLRESIISIGRGPENTIQIIDTRMSRNHTLLILNEGLWFARDLKSRNGTLVNNRPISGDCALHGGDHIQIGDTILVFEQDPAEIGGPSSGVCMLDDGGLAVATQVLSIEEKTGAEEKLTELLGVPVNDGERLGVLYTVADLISSILDLDELLDRLVGLIQKLLQSDRLGILLYDERHNILVPKVIRRPPNSNEDIVISNSIITKAVNERLAIIVSDAPHDFRFQASESIVIQRIHSAICAPLVYKDEILGVLYMDRRRPTQNYGENDLKLVAGIANQAALAIANSRLHHRLLARFAQARELEIARAIQQHLLPREMPPVPGFLLGGMNEAARMVGGDYYDVINLSDGRVVLVLADASGKGVPAAILTSSVRAAVQVEMRRLGEEELLPIVERLNQMVCRDSTNNMFVTMVLGVLEPAARRLTYVNAGHVYPLLRKPDGEIRQLDMGGCFLGIMPDTPYEQETVELPPGTVLMFYSDGVSDTINEEHEVMGYERVVEVLHGAARGSAEDVCSAIRDAALNFRKAAEPFDDFTVLVLKSVERDG